MNDRLGDLGESVPAWAVDDDDLESGGKGGGGELELPLTATNPFADDDADPWGGAAVAGGNDTDTGDAKAQQAKKHMESFFKDVDGIKEDIDSIREATRRVADINEQAVLATTTEEENDLSMKLRPLVDTSNKKAKRAKNMLALLKEDNAKLKEKDEVKQSDMRIRENLCNTLTRKFIDEMKLYQGAQQKYKSDIKKKMKRQVQIVKPDATDEEIEQVMRDEGGRDKLFRETILAGGVNDNITNAYQNVAGKYQDVLTLEQSVAELHQMFLDFAVLTEQQGELLDQIEFQVKSAADYVEDANVQVFESIQYQKKIRKKQCCITIIVLVVVLIILVWLGIIP